ncbi:MAG: peroxiredoxin [Salinisphaeraceae bacterium]|jgi:putative redox protein|nr:peroxiredoxin [Salinisphaeraceae bacterium]
MRATIDWQNNLHFSGAADSGHRIDIDGPPALGGENRGLRPMELILLGVGGCSAMDVMHILKKARQDITDCRIEVDGTRADSDPKVFTDIHLEFIVSGNDLSDKHVARAVKLSAEKYCSASIMLAASVNITHGYQIR